MPFSCISLFAMSSKLSRDKSPTTSNQLSLNPLGSLATEFAKVQGKQFPPVQTRYLRKQITPSSYCQNFRDTSMLSYAIPSLQPYPVQELTIEATCHIKPPSTTTNSPLAWLTCTPSLRPQQCETIATSHAREIHPNSTHACLIDDQKLFLTIASQTVENNNCKISDTQAEQDHSLSPVLSLTSVAPSKQADTNSILPLPKNQKQISDIQSPKCTIQYPPRAKAFIFKNCDRETLLSYVRKRKVCVQVINYTEPESDLDDLATQVCDTLDSFHDDELDEINILPESNDQIEPEPFCFSLRNELKLLCEMNQVEAEMMIQEDNLQKKLEKKVPIVAKNNRWRFWRRLFRKDKHFADENIKKFSDWASTYAATSTTEAQSNKGSWPKQKDSPQEHSRSIYQVIRRVFKKRKRNKRVNILEMVHGRD